MKKQAIKSVKKKRKKRIISKSLLYIKFDLSNPQQKEIYDKLSSVNKYIRGYLLTDMVYNKEIKKERISEMTIYEDKLFEIVNNFSLCGIQVSNQRQFRTIPVKEKSIKEKKEKEIIPVKEVIIPVAQKKIDPGNIDEVLDSLIDQGLNNKFQGEEK